MIGNSLIFLSSLLFFYLLICLIFYFYQNRLVFKPNNIKVFDAQNLGIPEESLFIPVGDHQIHLCLYRQVRNAELQLDKNPGSPAVSAGLNSPWMIFFHGNSGNLSGRLDSVKVFYEQGYNCMIFDYRGYGESSGSPSEINLYEDAEHAVRYLEKTFDLNSSNLLYFGRSLGGAVAIETALRLPPKRLIIESTFTSIPELGKILHPYFPICLLSRINFNNKEKIAQLNCPIEIIHSPDDELIPYFMAEELKEAAKLPQVHKIVGDHGEGYATDLKKYAQLIQKIS